MNVIIFNMDEYFKLLVEFSKHNCVSKKQFETLYEFFNTFYQTKSFKEISENIIEEFNKYGYTKGYIYNVKLDPIIRGFCLFENLYLRRKIENNENYIFNNRRDIYTDVTQYLLDRGWNRYFSLSTIKYCTRYHGLLFLWLDNKQKSLVIKDMHYAQLRLLKASNAKDFYEGPLMYNIQNFLEAQYTAMCYSKALLYNKYEHNYR